MPDIRLYPQGLGSQKSRPIDGRLVEFDVLSTERTRITLAQLNAGYTLLPALSGVRWKLVDVSLIAIGGNAAVADSADITGTQAAAPAILLSALIAGLTRSTRLRAGAANATLLADGASFMPCDANTAVSIATVGTAMTTLTHLDIIMSYTADAAA